MTNFDKAAGKLKQAGGEATDNERLEREGEVQEGLGKTKDKAEDVKDEFSDRWEDVKD
jgi:uncharacterized protein YjbJ (UPF0337 family)